MTKGVGLVVSSWTYQIKRVLDSLWVELNYRENCAGCAHDCMANLCGAKDNIVLVANDLKVAMRVKVNDKGLVTQRHRKLCKEPN